MPVFVYRVSSEAADPFTDQIMDESPGAGADSATDDERPSSPFRALCIKRNPKRKMES